MVSERIESIGMRLEFAYPWVLYLLWLAPALAAWWTAMLRGGRERLAAFVGPVLQPKLAPAGNGRRAAWQVGLLSVALAAMLTAAARPSWGERQEIVYTTGRDLIVALDVSRSMLAPDVRPNRLERAKMDLLDLIAELRGDRAGLIAFRHKATLLCPLTTDHAFLRHALDGAGIDSAPRGPTDVGDAIAKALDAFEHRQGSHRAIVLVSDGEDLGGRAIEMARRAAEAGVTIFTVGIGSRDGARIPDNTRSGAFVQHEGADVKTRLDHQTLYEIARLTGGAYVPVETAGMGATTLGSIYRTHLRRVSEREFDETLHTRRIERFQWFLLPGVLLALAACALSRGRLGRAQPRPAASAASAATAPLEAPPLRDLTPPPRPLRDVAALLLCLAAAALLPAAAMAQTNATDAGDTGTAGDAGDMAPAAARLPNAAKETPEGRDLARQAQRLYRQGDYEQAAQAYLKAAGGAGRRAARDFRYNAAVAAFHAGDYRRAADLLAELDTEAARPDAGMASGLGAALYRQAQAVEPASSTNLQARADLIESAAEAFRAAARADDDETARRNLAVTLQALPDAVQEATIARLLERYANADAFGVTDDMLRAQRDINARVEAAATNEVPERIRELERLAARQRETADLWIPLKGKLVEALAQQGETDEEKPDVGQLMRAMEATRDSMHSTARVLRDNRAEGAETGKVDENTVYRFWKGMAPSRPLLGEGIERQARALSATGSWAEPPREATTAVARDAVARELAETLDLTQLFQQRFEVEFPPTNAVPPASAVPDAAEAAPRGLSEDERKSIEAMTREAILSQQEAAEALTDDVKASREAQERSLELLTQVLRMLPKEESQERQDENQQDRQEQEQRQDETQEQKQDDREESEQTGELELPEQQEPSREEDAKEDKQPEESTPEEVREMLRRALEREREHADEKRERQRRLPAIPGERDW